MDEDYEFDFDEEEVEAVEEAVVLRDVGADTGSSLKRVKNTAFKHFNDFLKYLHDCNAVENPYTRYVSLHDKNFDGDENQRMAPEYITQFLFGKFSHYLIEIPEPKIKYETCLSYVSRVKCTLSYDYNAELGNTLFSQGRNGWYAQLRQKIERHYTSQCAANNTRLSDSAPPMTENDLELLCWHLLERNTNESLADRCLLVFQWQMLGRINELRQMDLTSIAFYNTRFYRCLNVKIDRSKTSDTQQLLVCMHNVSWKMCPFHALGSLLANRCSATSRIFQHGNSKYVNNLLKVVTREVAEGTAESRQLHELSNGLVYELTKDLRSQSSRSGGATALGEYPGIECHHIVPRGNWTWDRIHTMFR